MVAIVNGIHITKKQLRLEENFISIKNHDLDKQGLYQQALKNLIDAAIILQQTEKEGVVVLEEEIDEALVNFLSYFNNQDNYQSKLREVEITEEELRERLEKHVKVGKFLSGKFESKDNSCEELLKIFFNNNRELFTTDEKIRLSHILIEGDDAKAKESVNCLRNKISTAEDFLEQIKAFSCCPSSLQNGDLGYLLPGELIPELDEVAFELKEGEISDVIETPYGYHILMVTEVHPSRKLEFNEVREFLNDYHKKIMLELNVEKYLNKLREKAEIKML